MKRQFSLILLLCMAVFSGCNDNMLWEYQDDPYIANQAAQGEAEALRKVNAAKVADRQIALRLLAYRAAVARRQGNVDAALRLENVIIRRYQVEKESAVRASIVRICAPLAGAGSTRMVMFLRERIAAGEFPGYAALSLAVLAPRDAVFDIEPLTRHPAPEVRWQAALALAVLADARGFEAVNRVWKSMQTPAWPQQLDGIALLDAKNNLEARAVRAFSRSLYVR